MALRVVVHERQVAALMAGDISRGTARAAGRLRDRAKMNAPVDTGLLRNSINAELAQQTPLTITWRVGTDVSYAPYQEHGTGPIFARRAPMLVFKIGNRWVRTYSTRGVPAVHFLKRAADEVSARDFL